MEKKYKSLLNEHCHAKGILSPTYSSRSGGPAHAPYFIATLKVVGLEFTSAPKPNKKLAEEDVAAMAHHHLTNSQIGSVSPPPPAEILPEEKSGLKLWRQTLYEWCQKTRREPPIFTFVQTGPPHNPQFTAYVELTFDNQPLKFQSTTQFKKKQAEEDAAENAVTYLRNQISSKSSGEPLTTISQNISNSSPIPHANLHNSPQTIPNSTQTIPNSPQTIPNSTQTIPNITPSPTHPPNTSSEKKKKDSLSLQEFNSRFKPPLPDLSDSPGIVLSQYCEQHFGKPPSFLHTSSKGIWKFKIKLFGFVIGEGKHQLKDNAESEGYQDCLNRIAQLIQEDVTKKITLELWKRVFCYLDITTLMRFGLTNQEWLKFVTEHTVWEKICKDKYPDSSIESEENNKSQWHSLFTIMAMDELIDMWESKVKQVWDGCDFEGEVESLRESNSSWRYLLHLQSLYNDLVEPPTNLDPNGLFEIAVT